MRRRRRSGVVSFVFLATLAIVVAAFYDTFGDVMSTDEAIGLLARNVERGNPVPAHVAG